MLTPGSSSYHDARMDTVQLSFRYVEQDYVRAMRVHYASRLRLPLDIAVIVGVLPSVFTNGGQARKDSESHSYAC